MTPFAWRAKPEVWQTLAAKEVFDCQTDFNIRLWQPSYYPWKCVQRIWTPMPISTSPPRISAFFPIIEPIKRPTIIPNVDIIKVAQPMALSLIHI